MRGSIIDLARERQDGYDLTEWLDDHQTLTIEQLMVVAVMTASLPDRRGCQPVNRILVVPPQAGPSPA